MQNKKNKKKFPTYFLYGYIIIFTSFFFSSLIVTLQTVYPNSEILRLFHRNLTGYCLFPFNSDKASISRLSKKLYPTDSTWFMRAYDHATSATRNGYLFVDTSNDSNLRDKFRVRNFVAPVYEKSDEKNTDTEADTIRAVAKRNNQFLYGDLNTDNPTY